MLFGIDSPCRPSSCSRRKSSRPFPAQRWPSACPLRKTAELDYCPEHFGRQLRAWTWQTWPTLASTADPSENLLTRTPLSWKSHFRGLAIWESGRLDGRQNLLHSKLSGLQQKSDADSFICSFLSYVVFQLEILKHWNIKLSTNSY